MTMNKNLLIFLAIFVSYGEGASNNTLQLPITITPLLQDAIHRSSFTDSLININNKTFFEHIKFCDIIKNLRYVSSNEIKKGIHALVILGLAAKSNGLTVNNNLAPINYTITISAAELANVSNNITLPLNDQLTLLTIQEAMYKILEKRFNFKIEEIAEHLNTTKDEVYAFFEPGWIKVVNFITAKNVLALSRNYTIPPFYIAEALNMSLSELYSSTLPQLEDILVNKIDIIKEAAERWKLIVSSSITGLLRVSSTAFSSVMSTKLKTNSTVSTVMKQPTTMAKQSSFTSQTVMKTSSISTVMEQLTTMIIQSSFTSQTVMKTSSIFAETQIVTSKISTVMLQSSPIIGHQNSSMPGMVSSSAVTTGVQTAMSSFMESSSIPGKQISTQTATETEPITSMHYTFVSMTTIEVPQSKRSSTLQMEMLSSSISSYMSMSQPTTTELPIMLSTETVATITSKSSLMSESSKVGMVSSKSSTDLLETTSETIKTFSTQHITTIEIPPTQTMDKSTSEILPTSTILPESSPTIVTSSNTMDIKVSQDITKSTAINVQTPSMSSTITSTDMSIYGTSKTASSYSIKSSTVTEITSIITTSFVLVTPSYEKGSTKSPKLTPSTNEKISSSTPKLSTSSQLTMTTQYPSDVPTSSQIPKQFQTSSSPAHSSYVVLGTSAKTKEVSTSSRYQQSTTILKSSTRLSSTGNGLVIPVKSSSYHATSSSSREQATVTPTTPVVDNASNARSEDNIDTVVVIVIPIMCILFLLAIILAFVMWIRHRRRQKSAVKENGQNGSKQSRRSLVKSLENENNNQSIGLTNRGMDDRSSRSMSRTSSISNLETIHEGNEPEVPEIYDL